jgi:GTP-binding protein HflX
MPKNKIYDTAVKPERVVLVGLITANQTEAQEKEYLDELAFLVETAGGITEKRFTQKMQRPERATFVGTGKLEEIQEYVKAEEIDIVVFDDERVIDKSFLTGETLKIFD